MSLVRKTAIEVPDVFDVSTDNMIKAVTDEELPEIKSSDRIKIGEKWSVSMKTTKATFEMDKLSLWKATKARVSGLRSLNNVEIHVIWRPYIPNNDEGWKITMVLNWIPGKMPLQYVVQPLHLHSHVIFKPNHSAPLSSKEKLPWNIDFIIEDTDIEPNHRIADIFIELHGVIGNFATWTPRREAILISLCPAGEHFNGITMNRPYRINDPWKIGNHTVRVNTSADRSKLLLLQDMGFDLQGLTLCEVLPKVLSVITTKDMKEKDKEDVKKLITYKVNQIVEGNSPKLVRACSVPAGSRF